MYHIISAMLTTHESTHKKKMLTTLEIAKMLEFAALEVAHSS